jgi:aminodeoxyfutalosine synthase
VLTELKAVGLNALPGGGAELFSKRIRKKFCPDKLTAEGWLSIHKSAHRLGLDTNATMLYGIGENPEELLDHMMRLRDAEDEAPGFSCFIPLPFQPGRGADIINGPAPLKTLGIIALARLVLDNIAHIKAYWPMFGLETASAALSFGADDLDGTIGEELIAHAAGAMTPKAMSRERMETTIRLGGYTAVARDGRFNPINLNEDHR